VAKLLGTLYGFHLALALIIHWVCKPDWSIVVGDLRLLC